MKITFLIFFTLFVGLMTTAPAYARGGGVTPVPPQRVDIVPANLQAEIVPDPFGFIYSTSVSGDTLITNGISVFNTTTYVYERTGTIWSLQTTLSAADGAVLCCIAKISGDNAVVMGSVTNPVTGLITTSPYIFHRTPATVTTPAVWKLEKKLTGLGIAPIDFARRGSSPLLAVDGNTVAVAVNAGIGANVFIYKRIVNAAGVPVWARQALLTNTGASARSGSISLSGNTLVLSDYSVAGLSGQVLVYQRTLNTWSQQAVLTSGVTPSGFGYSVGVSGNNLVIGAVFESAVDPKKGFLLNSGAIYFFERTGTTWVQKAKFPNPTPSRLGAFGSNVSISGANAAITAPGNGPASLYVFQRGATTWSRIITNEPKGTFLDFSYNDGFIGVVSDISVSGKTYTAIGQRLDPTLTTTTIEDFVFTIP